jgi:hypothetical protein
LDDIYRKEAEKRIVEGASKKAIGSQKDVANLPLPTGDLSTGKPREKLSEATGVPQKKLDTILEIGELAETGKTKEIRRVEEAINTLVQESNPKHLEKITELKTRVSNPIILQPE